MSDNVALAFALIAHCLCNLNSAINPVIYYLMSGKIIAPFVNSRGLVDDYCMLTVGEIANTAGDSASGISTRAVQVFSRTPAFDSELATGRVDSRVRSGRVGSGQRNSKIERVGSVT